MMPDRGTEMRLADRAIGSREPLQMPYVECEMHSMACGRALATLLEAKVS
jgi:hypothetical protein